VSNYRPISLLSIFSKLIEKLMHKRLYSFLMSNKILYHYQFGFRKSHSPTLALIEVIFYLIWKTIIFQLASTFTYKKLSTLSTIKYFWLKCTTMEYVALSIIGSPAILLIENSIQL